MSAEMEVFGLDELKARTSELGRRGSIIANAALLKAAEPILKEAIENAPADPRKTKHASDLLKISRPKTKKNTKYVIVGLDKSDNSEAFYLKFHEFGTVKLTAKPFLGPAYESNKKKTVLIMAEEIRRGLGLK